MSIWTKKPYCWVLLNLGGWAENAGPENDLCHDADGAGKVQCTLFAVGYTERSCVFHFHNISHIRLECTRYVSKIVCEMCLAMSSFYVALAEWTKVVLVCVWKLVKHLRLSLGPPMWMMAPPKLWRHPELRQAHSRWQPQGAVLVPQVSWRRIAAMCACSLHAPASSALTLHQHFFGFQRFPWPLPDISWGHVFSRAPSCWRHCRLMTLSLSSSFVILSPWPFALARVVIPRTRLIQSAIVNNRYCHHLSTKFDYLSSLPWIRDLDFPPFNC